MSLTALLNVVCILKEQATKTRNTVVGAQHQQRQIIRIMRLTAILLTAFCLQVAAGGKAQTLSLSLKNASMEKAFKEIEKQSGYSFIYLKENLQGTGTVNLVAKNETLETVLQKLFKDQPLTYTFSGNYIVVKQKSPNADAVISNETEKSPPIDVTGKVTDADGNPLAGATVKVKGTSKGTTTNNDGVFILKGVDENATLEISFVGYETYTVAVNSKSTIIASLKIKPESLNEVVINKGYYTEKQRLSVSNVGKVTAKDIEKQPVNNPLLALEGKVPGLFITQVSGLAGSGITVRIQGRNSIDRGTDPFYVIDGVPYVSLTLPTINNILGQGENNGASFIPFGAGNPLSYINSADIESIEVLKDADATAIYGSRAANGAILITTKKGKVGQTRVNINMQNGWGKVTRKLDLLNTHQYLEMRHEAKVNDNASISASDYDMNGKWDTTRNTNWQKELLGGTAKYKDVQASVSGGNSFVQFLFGGGYHKETTVFPGDFTDQKGSMHFSINSTSSNQKFKAQLSGNYLADDNKLPFTDLTQIALQLPPNAPKLYNSDGSLNWEPLPNGNSTWTNPLQNTIATYNVKTNNLISNAMLSYRLLPGLDLKASCGYTRTETNEIQKVPMLAVPPEVRPFFQRQASFGKGVINSWILEPQVTYNHNFGKGKLDMLAGTTFQENKNNLQQLSATGFNSDLVMENIKSASSVIVGSTLISNYKYNAIFSRINFNWNDKYVVNVTGRRDGSSRFGPNNLFHNFWSIGGGWIFSNERFVQQNLAFVSFGKLRASYGTTGNDQIGDYQFLNLYTPVDGIAVSYQGVNSIEPNGIPNPYLQWEETKKLQIGLDLGFISERILLSLNYNQNRSSNQLLSYSLPIITGVGNIIENFPAKIQNTGWEFSISSDNIRSGQFKWNTGVNLSIPMNKLLEFPGIETSTYSDVLVVGKPFTTVKRYHFAGVDPTTGKYTFYDSKGIPTLNPNPSTDRTVLINTSPTIYGGLQNSFSYKGFELGFLFQFVKQKGANYSFGFRAGRSNLNQPDYVLDRWRKPGDITDIQKFYSNSSLNASFSNATNSDAAYADASFIRLRNLSLSWQFPQAILKKMRIQNLRLYSSAQNLLTITKYQGLDPENRSTNKLPLLRVITVGVQATL